MSKTKRVDLNFPVQLLLELDDWWPDRYANRTAAIHDAIRKLMEDGGKK